MSQAKSSPDSSLLPVLVGCFGRNWNLIPGVQWNEHQRCATIAQAKKWLVQTQGRDWRLNTGFLIEAPCGVQTDREAILLARKLGLPHDTAEAALLALVGVNPDLP